MQTGKRKPSLKKVLNSEETKVQDFSQYKIQTPAKPKGEFKFRAMTSPSIHQVENSEENPKINLKKTKPNLQKKVIGYSLIILGWYVIIGKILILTGLFDKSTIIGSYTDEIGLFTGCVIAFIFFGHVGLEIFKNN